MKVALKSSLEIERAAFSVLLRDGSIWEEFNDSLSAELMYDTKHKTIMSAMKAIYEKEKVAPTSAMIFDYLQEQGSTIVDYGYFRVLEENWTTSASFPTLLSKLKEDQQARALTMLLIETREELTQLGDRTIADVIASTELKLKEIAKSINHKKKIENAQEAVEALLSWKVEHGDFGGYRTGYLDLDKKIDGVEAQSFTIIAARPNIGKTTFALSLFKRFAEQAIPVGFISLEMNTALLTLRLVQMDAHCTKEQFVRSDEKIRERLNRSYQYISKLPIFFRTPDTFKASHVCIAMKELIAQHNCQVLFIDHLQEIQPDDKDESRQRELAKALAAINQVRKETNVTVVLLCQINRSAESQRGDKRPKLYQLRDTGEIEQIADLVLGLSESEEDNHVLEVEVLKNRNGPKGDLISLSFLKSQQRLENYAPGGEYAD